MSGRIFFDSNILIYAYSTDDLSKKQCVKMLAESHDIIIISTQTINECVSVLHKKKKMSYEEIVPLVNEMRNNFVIELIDENSISKAIDIAIKYSYSYFDSFMIAAALTSNCSVLYTEDMHNQHVVEGDLKIVNPFTQKINT